VIARRGKQFSDQKKRIYENLVGLSQFLVVAICADVSETFEPRAASSKKHSDGHMMKSTIAGPSESLSGVMDVWNSDIFAPNCKGIAAYTEPHYHRLKTGCHKLTYAKWVSNTVGGAKFLFDQIPEQREWAVQLDDGPWSWHIDGVKRKMRGREIQGKPLKVFALVKHLCGRGYAIGVTNRPWKGGGSVAQVKFLRIDVDNDAWLYRLDPSMVEALWVSLDRHAEILSQSGLSYTVFRTGNRGVQYVVQLPSEVSHEVASVLVAALRGGLRRAPGTDFKSDLEGILRLPLGLHAKSGRIGAFIDVENRRLYDPGEQESLLLRSFSPSPMIEGFDEFAAEMSTSASANVVLKDREGLERLASSRNPLALRLLSMLPPSHQPTHLNIGVQDKRSSSPLLPNAPLQPTHLNYIGVQDKVWAGAVWSIQIRQGHFWNWIRRGTGGSGGVKAARVLFGPTMYEQKLIDKARTTPYASSRDLQDRIHSIQSLVRNYNTATSQTQVSSPCPKLQPPSEVAVALSERLVSEIPRQPHARWSGELAQRVLSLIVEAIFRSSKCIASASIGMVMEGLEAVWGTAPSRSAVATVLRVLDGSGAIIRQPQGRKNSLPDMWTLG
jgi:hypothetical protein